MWQPSPQLHDHGKIIAGGDGIQAVSMRAVDRKSQRECANQKRVYNAPWARAGSPDQESECRAQSGDGTDGPVSIDNGVVHVVTLDPNAPRRTGSRKI